MRRFREAITSNVLVVLAALAVAMTVGVSFNSVASAQETADTTDFGPWFVSAPVREIADADEMMAAAKAAVTNCPQKRVLCVGSASGDRESSVRNTEYATARKEQCVAAVRKSGGSPMSLSFLATGTGSENGRGIMMFCAGGTQGPPGQSARIETRDATEEQCPNGGKLFIVYNGETKAGEYPICNGIAAGGGGSRRGGGGGGGDDEETRSAKDWFSLNFRATMGYTNLPGFERQHVGVWGVGFGLNLPDLSRKFGLRASYDYGMLFTSESFLNNSHVEVGMLLGPWGANELFSFHLSYAFDLGQSSDFTETVMMGHQAMFGMIFRIATHFAFGVDISAGKGYVTATSSHTDTHADGSVWRTDTVTRIGEWMVNTKAVFIVPFW